MNTNELTPLQSVLHWFHIASEEDKLDGLQWYQEANLFATYLSLRYDLDVLTCAHLIAVFSPQLGWGENKNRVEKFIVVYQNKGNYFSAGLGFKSNIRKAVKIIEGNLDALSGQKVTAFAHCIFKNGYTERVCIDRHAKRIANFHTENSPSAKQYIMLEGLYQLATIEINRQNKTHYTASQIQAITWVAFRRFHNLSENYD